MNEITKALFTTSETADFLGIHKNTLYEWTRQNILPKPAIINGRWRFKISDIRQWVASGCPNLENYNPEGKKQC
jgi:excisionase family DNA binding protein